MTLANSPRMVSRFEERLLRILHFLLRRDPAGQAISLIFDVQQAPTCLSRDAVLLVQDTLAKGCIALLARTSGWWQERHLKDGSVAAGRLWERHAPADLAFSFSRLTLRWLIWITAETPGSSKTAWPELPPEELTLGDQFFFYNSFLTLRDTEATGVCSGKQVFLCNALCRLAFPDNFTEARELPDFASWMAGTGAAILEALQGELTERWLKIDRDKARIGDWKRMQALGQSQERILQAFLDAVARVHRFDLARFLLPALQALLPENPRLEWWTENLRGAGPRLADRAETHRAALVLLRLLSRLQEWEQQARLVGYFDDHYAACQLYKSDWEHWQGPVLLARAQRLLGQIEPLRQRGEQS